MDGDLKKNFHSTGEGFIRTTDSPVKSLTSEQKVLLNRKGNVLFNSGDIEGALRIYKATGYSDGLIRAGDKFAEAGNEITALKLYYLAHNKTKTDFLCSKIARAISIIMQEKE